MVPTSASLWRLTLVVVLYVTLLRVAVETRCGELPRVAVEMGGGDVLVDVRARMGE